MSDAEDVRAVMEADRWIDRVRSQRSHLPEITELADLEAALRAMLQELHDAEASLVPLKNDYTKVASESERLRSRVTSLDATLTSSTANARELSAIQSELTHVRSLLVTSEDRELELLVELEPKKAEIDAIKQRAQPGVLRRSELREAIAQLQSTLDEELAALAVSRERVASALSSDLRSRYERALTRVGTSGAAQVVEGRCDGCRLALSPLDYDRFKSQPTDTLMDCPECGRMLLP